MQIKNLLSFIEVKKCQKLGVPPNNILFPVIWITNKCNLRCKMCDQWKTDETMLSQELTAQEWYSFIDSVSRMYAIVITITGGEPLLREDIFDIIKYIRKKGIACHLCSNGIMLDEVYINKLKETGINSISVSLDSYCAEIHNELRGVDCFETVIKGIKLLRQIAPEIKVGINYVINKKNFHNMDQMISFAENLGVNQIKFDPIHTNLVHRKKTFSSFEGLLFNKDDLSELQFEIKKLINATLRTKLLTNSYTFMKGISNLYNGRYRGLPCYAGYVSCAIDALGRVSPCEEIDGNEALRVKSFEEIWNSAHFQRMRQKVNSCTSYCWDTTHAEINIRCSKWNLLREFGQILREINFYLSR